MSDSISAFGTNGSRSYNWRLPSIIQGPTKGAPFSRPFSVMSCHFSHSPGCQCKSQHLNWVGKVGNWGGAAQLWVIIRSLINRMIESPDLKSPPTMTAVTHSSFSTRLFLSAGLSSAQLLQSNIWRIWQLLLPATSK